MSETELQGLSRDAAGCLPKPMRNFSIAGAADFGQNRYGTWLHESTEACAEIEKRELNLRGFYPRCFKSEFETGCVWWYDISKEIRIILEPGGDLMACWRECVLRALVALKGKP